MDVFGHRHGIAATLLGDTDTDHRVTVIGGLEGWVAGCKIEPGIIFGLGRTIDDFRDITEINGNTVDDIDDKGIEFLNRT